MLEQIDQIIKVIEGAVWGLPLNILILFTGFLLTNRQGLLDVYKRQVYDSFLFDFMKDMKECVKIADKAGIARDKIILDPGVGFGKTYEMNLEIIQKLEIMHEFKLPILLGTSRKSVIGLTLDLPADEREEGTLVTTVYAVQKRCAFVRVHDVEKNKRAILMTQALMRDCLLYTSRCV